MLRSMLPNIFNPLNWQQLGQEFQVTWQLLWDDRVPLYAKAIPLGTGLYVIMPIDLLPDAVPIIGKLDDIVLMLVALRVFVALAPREVVEEYARQRDIEMKMLA